MTYSILLLLAGVVLAWFGGSLFVDGSVGLARWARWPVAVIGVTVAAFGTSSPELMVAIQAAADGVPEISLGDVVGSNVLNIALVLALVLSWSGMKAEDAGVRRDWACALAVPFVLAAVLWDGWFSRLDALILMGLFALWLTMVVRHARRHRARNVEEVLEAGRAAPLTIVLRVVGGLALLIAAAQLVVHGGKGVALALGWSPFLVGAVVVAVATGTPELATTIISRIRGHHDVGLGNILGSNIFNALFIAALAALIHPFPVKRPELMPGLIFGVVTTLMIWPGRSGWLGRWRGFVLLACYIAFVFVTLKKTRPSDRPVPRKQGGPGCYAASALRPHPFRTDVVRAAGRRIPEGS
ncbi:MAG: calcium/sodium antiporter [Verrucomicrobiota bacterium]